MLDKWQNDILESICKAQNKRKDEYVKSDCLLANAILFELVNSYAWTHEFKGAALITRDDTSGQSWVDFPAYDDPDTQNSLRYEERVNCLDWKYAHSYEYEDADEHWPINEKSILKTISEIDDLPFYEETKTKLKEDDYYEMLLEKDPTKQAKNLRELNNITYTIYEELDYHELLLQTKMHRYSGNPLVEIFGHGYTKSCENRIMVVARNKLGPVGIAALFDYSKSPNMQNKDRLSLSYVSVTPSFRCRGISTRLLNECLQYAEKNQKFITRTSSSPMGSDTIFESFGDFAEKNYPMIPFVKNEEISVACALYDNSEFNSLNNKNRLKLVKEFIAISNSELERMRVTNKHASHYDLNTDLLLKGFLPTIRKHTAKSADQHQAYSNPSYK